MLVIGTGCRKLRRLRTSSRYQGDAALANRPYEIAGSFLSLSFVFAHRCSNLNFDPMRAGARIRCEIFPFLE